ncbi:hypothetical protein [Ottowia thiooxydans]|nr:hypothetical protein [Ottowia thiooxydans]
MNTNFVGFVATHLQGEATLHRAESFVLAGKGEPIQLPFSG